MSTSGSTPPTGTSSVGGRRRQGTRVFLVALAVSVLLHLGVVWLLPTFLIVVQAPSGPSTPDRPTQRIRGMEVVQLQEDVADPLSDPQQPVDPAFDEPEPPPSDEPIRDDQPEVIDAPPPDGPAGPTVADRIRPPLAGDSRIWRPVAPDLTELTPGDRALIRIYATLDALADSLVDAEERQRRAREWLFTDADGNQWGISPGRLHLGETTVPIPTVGAPPSIEDQWIRWQYDDAQRAAAIARIRDAWDDRAEAIRDRVDAEREAERARDDAEARPDSTGSGG